MTGRRGAGFVALLAGGALLTAACASPVGVRRMDPKAVQRGLTANVLSTGALSAPTRAVLARRALGSLYARDPEQGIATLRSEALPELQPDDVFALAEISFLHAERTTARPHYRAAALYAYAFLFPEDPALIPDSFDPRLRTAADLYNRALSLGFRSEDRLEVLVHAGRYQLPFGAIEIAFRPEDLLWAGRRIEHLVPGADFDVRGLRNRYRRPGIGASLAGDAPPAPGAPSDDLVARRLKVPVTLLLRVEDPRHQVAGDHVDANFELHPIMDRTVEIGGREVPLEAESSSTLALMLQESRIWEREVRGFLREYLGAQEEAPNLVALAPHRPGRTPVVFVHGTASSPGRWAEMFNELANDPRLAGDYEAWFFTYDTGNPIAYSAGLLRDSLSQAVTDLDPEGKDAGLRRMVLVGHSQGGLLCKMATVDTGSRLWDGVSRVPIDQLDVRPQTREQLRRAFFVKPLPFVSRVIFLATPQRGSFVAGQRLARWVSGLIELPQQLVSLTTDVATLDADAFRMRLSRIPTSVDNMTPGHPFVRTLGTIPVAPGVAVHSIIAVRGAGPVEKGDDGVVSYRSAHVEDADSELVVRSGHSVQDNPEAIEEVRRILLLQSETQRR